MGELRVNTVIIGGGIAGLTCARHLSEAGVDFRLVSPDIGGRIKTSKDGSLNYGAYGVTSEYRNFLRFAEMVEDVKSRRGFYHRDGRRYGTLSRSLFRYPWQTYRFVRAVLEFREAMRAFKVAAERQSQRALIERDPYLKDLFETSAPDLVRRLRIEALSRDYLEHGMRASMYYDLADVSAFTLLQIGDLFVGNMSSFRFDTDAMTAPFRSRIIKGRATGLRSLGDGYAIETDRDVTLMADNVVVATPLHVAKKLLELEVPTRQSRCFSVHLRGRLRPEWHGVDFHLPDPSDPLVLLTREGPGETYLLSAVDGPPDLERYFEHAEIIASIAWDPAFTVATESLIDAEQGPGLYLIGDYNIPGVEHACITGMFAANRVLARATAPEAVAS